MVAQEKSTSPAHLLGLASQYETRSAQDIIAWTLEKFGSRVAVCTAFQAEGMAVLDMAYRVDPNLKVFTIDTGRLPQETHDLIDKVRDRYGISIEVYYPDQDELGQMVTKNGANLFRRSVSLRLLCCEVRKVNPLKNALRGLDAWITGLRRSQSPTRASVGKIELDPNHDDIVKVNPLADWSDQEVWSYIRANDVPYNRLYDQGYTSIGCAPCTRPTLPGEDARAGRWWWEGDVPKECGMHVSIAPTQAGGAGIGPASS